MKKFFLALMFVVALTFANTCVAADVWISHHDLHGVDTYVMTETIKDTTPPSAHEYRNFEVSIKEIKDGQVENILTYLFTQVRENPWEHQLLRDKNGSPPYSDRYLVPAGSKLFEFCIRHLGWSYTIKDGHYY